MVHSTRFNSGWTTKVSDSMQMMLRASRSRGVSSGWCVILVLLSMFFGAAWYGSHVRRDITTKVDLGDLTSWRSEGEIK